MLNSSNIPELHSSSPIQPPFEAYCGDEPYLFISYAHKDSEVVFAEIERLHRLGYRVWYDEGIDPGNEWPEHIALALLNCAFFLVFISPLAVESINVKNEINYALNRHKPFLAVHIEATSLPPGLELRMGDIQAVMKYRMAQDRYERQMEKALPLSLKGEPGELSARVPPPQGWETGPEKRLSTVTPDARTLSSKALGTCPLCGDPHFDTLVDGIPTWFACRGCGQTPLCRSHRNPSLLLCPDCAQTEYRKKADSLVVEAQATKGLEEAVALLELALETYPNHEDAGRKLEEKRQRLRARRRAEQLVEQAVSQKELVKKVFLYKQAVEADETWEAAQQGLHRTEEQLAQHHRLQAEILVEAAREEADLERRVSLYKRALAEDATFAQAQQGMEQTHTLLENRRRAKEEEEQRRREGQTRARELVEQAEPEENLSKKLALYEQAVEADNSLKVALKGVEQVRRLLEQHQQLLGQARTESDLLSKIAIYEQALELDASSEVAREELAQAKEQLQRRREAEAQTRLEKYAPLLNLRGNMALPGYLEQGMELRFGFGEVTHMVALDFEKVVVLSNSGAGLYDLRSRESLWTIDCPAKGGAVSVDGAIIALGGLRGISLWDLRSGELLQTLEARVTFGSSMDISPDGHWLAVGDEENYVVRLWNLRDGRWVCLPGHTSYIWNSAFSHDNHWLATIGNDKTVRLWDVSEEPAPVWSVELDTVLDRASFSPEGHLMAVASTASMFTGTPPQLLLMDVANGREVQRLDGEQGQVTSMCFSPDGRFLAFGDWREHVHVWDVAAWREVRTLDHGKANGFSSLAFAPNGEQILTASEGTVRLWELELSGELIPPPIAQGGREVMWLAGEIGREILFSPDGQLLVTMMTTTVRMWDRVSGKGVGEIRPSDGLIGVMALSPDGKHIALAEFKGKSIGLFDLKTGQKVNQWGEHRGPVKALALSPDGQLLASSGSGWSSDEKDSTIWLWKVDAEQPSVRLQGHGETVVAIAFSPDGRLLASASEDKTIRLWDVQQGRELRVVEGGEVQAKGLAFVPNGKCLAGFRCRDNNARLWDVSSGQEVKRMTGCHCLAFSLDGRKLALSTPDGIIRLGAIGAGSEARRVEAHSGRIESLAFSPDGQLLASVGDGVVRLWRVS